MKAMLDLKHLNNEQNKAVTHKDGPLLIVAGAGTGKTTVLTNRVAWLIDQGLAKPEEILCLTFTDKASGEMEERIDKLLPYGYVDLWVMTFHAFAERILKQYGLEIGLPSGFKLLDQTTQWMLVHDNFNAFNLHYYKPLGSPIKFISSMLTHFSRAKDEGITPGDYLKYVKSLKPDLKSKEFISFSESIIKKKKDVDLEELWLQEIERRKEIANAYQTYQNLLLENDSLDFGDLIVYLKKLFTERPAILARYQKQFKYIMIDEFQDTNWAQYDLMRLLGEEHENITVVGDDDQSVYKFRGASLSNILGFKSDYPKAKQVVLTQNYRSTQNILDLAYDFIQNNNPHRLEFQLNQDEEANKAASEKNIDLSGFKAINKSLKSVQNHQGTIEHLHYSTLADESAGVVKKMIDIRKANPTLGWGDFAILVRANNSAQPFLQQLTLAEIPYQFMASKGLFSKSVILNILSYLRLLDDYAESSALYRILILPTVDLSNDDLMKLLQHTKQKGISLREAIKLAIDLGLSSEGIEKCNTVSSRLDQHAYDARTKRISEIAMSFIDEYGLKQYFEDLAPLAQRDIYGLLNHFWKIMQQFETENDDKTLKPFLAYLKLAEDAGDTGALPNDIEAGPDTVKIMTIHGSKGLEFEHVFLVSLVDRRFPTTERKDAIPIPEELINEITPGDNHHLEEERRLCYVALTRAKSGLYLTSAEDYGGARKKKVSRFLNEMEFEKDPPLQKSSNLQFGETFTRSFEAQKAKDFNYKDYLPKTFSFSQLKVFQTCPWQYRYAFIMKIPVRGRFTFSFGKSLHNTLEQFFNLKLKKEENKDIVVNKKVLLELYEKNWIDDWYKDQNQKDEYFKKGKESIESFFEIHQGKWPKVEATEQPFTLKVSKYSLRGSIDRVDRVENGLQLIDYKTGNVPKSDRSLDKDQLTLYQIAVKEIMGEKVEELTYYYLNENLAKTFTVTEKQEEKLKEKIIKTLDTLTESDFAPTPSKQVCVNCDYKDICQYRML